MNYLCYERKYSGKSTEYWLDWDSTGTWSTHGCLWWRIYMNFSIAKVHWKTNCGAECHLPCINSPGKEHLHRPGTPLAALRGQKQVIWAKKIFQKAKKQRSYNLFIYITLLEFPLFSLAKLANVERINESPPRHTRCSLCRTIAMVMTPRAC